MQFGRLIEQDRKSRELALKAEAEKIYSYGQQEDERRKKVWTLQQCPSEGGLCVLTRTHRSVPSIAVEGALGFVARQKREGAATRRAACGDG